MDDIRTLAGLAHAARDVADVKVRQPLPSLQCVVPGDAAAVSALGDLLASELNVKQVEFVTSTDALVSLEAKANFRTLGKKFGKETPLVAEAVGSMSGDLLRQLAAGASVTIEVAGADRLIAPDDVAIIRRASGAAVVQENGGYGVALDPTITPELREEGLAREVISRVQRLRKEAQLAVSDRILLAVAGDPEVEGAVAAHRSRIAEEVLAVRLLLGDEVGSTFSNSGEGAVWTATQAGDVDGRPLRLALTKEDS
jgi:isoleucyl-tRNA synthetase